MSEIIYSNGSRYHYDDNGNLHREDGPAVERSNGTKGWYQNGKLHRLDGPALIDERGIKYWYQYDKLHREDGPAIVYPLFNNRIINRYYLNNIYYSEEEFDKRIKCRAFW